MTEQYVIKHGRPVDDPEFDRGSILLWTEEEWKTRRKKHYRSSYKNTLMRWVLVAQLLLIGLLAMANLIHSERGIGWPILLFAALGLGGVFLALWDPPPGSQVLGIYDIGVQIEDYFIPYEEIESITPMPRGMVTPPSILFHPQHKTSWPYRWPRQVQWKVPVLFLGEEGVRELQARVRAPGSPE